MPEMHSRQLTYGNFKYLLRRTAYEKVLRDKAFNIVKNCQIMVVIKEILLQWLINVLIKSIQVVLLHVHSQRT